MLDSSAKVNPLRSIPSWHFLGKVRPSLPIFVLILPLTEMHGAVCWNLFASCRCSKVWNNPLWMIWWFYLSRWVPVHNLDMHCYIKLTIWKCFFLDKLPLFRFFRWTNGACLCIRIIDNSPALGATFLLFCSTWTIFLILTVAKHPREISDLVTSLFTAWNYFTQDSERCWPCLRIQIWC